MALAQPEFAEEQPQTHNLPLITNIAQAEWDIGGQRLRKPSNRIDIQVVPPPDIPPEITIFHLSDPPGAEKLPILGTTCRGSGGNVMVELGGVFSGTPNPAPVMPTDSIRAGEPLIMSILAPGRNRNPLAIDNFDIVLTMPSGDREQINIVETAPDSGRFVGMINTAAVPPAAVQGDCILSVRRGDTVDITIYEVGGAPIGTANVGILVDPFGETFDSGDGAPVSGTRVTLIDDATGLPAEVFGDDGVSSYPSTVISSNWPTSGGQPAFRSPLSTGPMAGLSSWRIRPRCAWMCRSTGPGRLWCSPRRLRLRSPLRETPFNIGSRCRTPIRFETPARLRFRINYPARCA